MPPYGDYTGPDVPSPAPSPWPPAPSPWPPELSPSPASVPDVYGFPPINGATSHNYLLRTLLVSIAALLAASILLLTYCIVLRRYRNIRRRRAAAPPPPPPQPHAPFNDDLRQDLLAGGGAAEEPYHVWHIRTTGLDDATIGAIAAVPYRREEGLVEGTDCAVCLGEYHDGELLRLLPKCSHAFHLPCIDTWLRSHQNCPLCRAPILAPPSPPPHVAIALPLLAPSSSSPSAFGDRPGSSGDGSEEVWMRIELGSIGSGDGGGHNNAGPGGAPQPVRRSVSMDPAALGGLLLRMGLVGGGGSGESRAKAEVDMGRSMSSSGGSFLLSRFSGRTRGAVLPL